jgi:hypothetical protein
MRTMTRVEGPAWVRARAGLWINPSVAVRVGCSWAHEPTARHRRPPQTNTHSPPPGNPQARGQEYLRLIYGPDYLRPANLTRLRERNLQHKRSLALREYALGLESIDRLVQGEPLWRVHEAVFAVLALESEPVDPRL